MSDSTNVNKVLDKVLTTADKITESGNILTSDQVEEISKVLKEARDANPDLKKISEMPSNNGILEREVPEGEEVTSETVLSNYNPITGEIADLGNIEDYEENDSASLEELIDEEASKLGDPLAIEVTLEDVKKSDDAKKYGLTDTEVEQLYATIKAFQGGQNEDLFELLPVRMQSRIRMQAAMGKVKLGKRMRNDLSIEVVKDIIKDKAFGEAQIEFQTSMNKALSEEVPDVLGQYTSSITTKKKQMYDLADKVDIDTKKSRLMAIGDAAEESYTYTKFKDALKEGKIRIRKIDLEYPEKVYKVFNSKYKNSTFNINDVNIVPNILNRILSKDVATGDDIIYLSVAFCKYCEKMKPSNLDEHTFMYYFIKNIAVVETLSLSDQKSNEFRQLIVDNIISVIDIIKEITAE